MAASLSHSEWTGRWRRFDRCRREAEMKCCRWSATTTALFHSDRPETTLSAFQRGLKKHGPLSYGVSLLTAPRRQYNSSWMSCWRWFGSEPASWERDHSSSASQWHIARLMEAASKLLSTLCSWVFLRVSSSSFTVVASRCFLWLCLAWWDTG